MVSTFAVGVVTLTNPNNINLASGTTECAQHYGYHYDEKEATSTESGHLAFYACCKCNHQYLERPNGEFLEGNEESMTGGISSDHIAYIPTTLAEYYFDTETVGTNEVKITKYNGGTYFDYVNIPKTIYGSKVVEIGDHAFYNGCSFTSVYIPNTVKTIGKYAFSGKDIKNLVIPNSVTTLGDGVFQGCNNLKTVVINHTLTSIPSWTFAQSGLTTMHIPSNITSIGSSAFNTITTLEAIVIPSSVTSIGGYAFYNSSPLTIYCEASSKPDGWDVEWNVSELPVVWSYKQ